MRLATNKMGAVQNSDPLYCILEENNTAMKQAQPVIHAIHELATQIKTPVTLILCGSMACFVQHWIENGRTTGDCDVFRTHPPELFQELRAKAAILAAKHNLSTDWFNEKAKSREWKMPLGCEKRAVVAEVIGNVTIMTLCRKDLVASKIMGQRPHDLEDLKALKPTAEELDHAEKNLDRVEAEDLDRTEFPKARAFIADLRKDLADRQTEVENDRGEKGIER